MPDNDKYMYPSIVPKIAANWYAFVLISRAVLPTVTLAFVLLAAYLGHLQPGKVKLHEYQLENVFRFLFVCDGQIHTAM